MENLTEGEQEAKIEALEAKLESLSLARLALLRIARKQLPTAKWEQLCTEAGIDPSKIPGIQA